MEKKEKVVPQTITRRKVVKGIAVTGAVASVGPWILPKKAILHLQNSQSLQWLRRRIARVL